MSHQLSAKHFLIAAKDAEITTLHQLKNTLLWVRVLCDLVHHLQRERGLSNVYLASDLERMKSDRAAAMAASDKCVSQLYELVTPNQDLIVSGKVNARLMTGLAMAVLGLNELDDLRVKVTNGFVCPSDSTQGYNRLVSYLIAVIFEAADVSTDPDVTHTLTALFSLIQGKEYAAQERALTAIGFANGRFSYDLCQRIAAILDLQSRSFLTFSELASESIFEKWRALEEGPVKQSVVKLRKVRDQLCGADRLESSLSEVWYEQATRRIDELRSLEVNITAEVSELCESKLKHAELAKTQEQEKIATLPLGDSKNILLSHRTTIGYEKLHEQAETASEGALSHTLYDLIRDQQQKIRELTESLTEARASLVEQKQIELAKDILSKNLSLDEEQAHRALQQSAMNQNKTLLQMAKQVIQTYRKAQKNAPTKRAKHSV